MAGGAVDTDTDEAITGINVTPLVDVMLVLLIILIVTAKHIVSQSVPLDLPKAASGTEVQVIFSVVLAADGTTQVDSRTVANDDAILPLARDAHAKNNELRAVIKADSQVSHGRVIHVLDLLKQAGVGKIAFGVTPVPPVAPVAPKK
jgi:biopolymer transport protein ExbD